MTGFYFTLFLIKNTACTDPMKNIRNSNIPTSNNFNFHGTHQNNHSSFKGISFQNISRQNICYINATLNLLLSSFTLRSSLPTSICDCSLCLFLKDFINQPSLSHYTRILRTWISQFFEQFDNTLKQDAQEFFVSLIQLSSLSQHIAQLKNKKNIPTKVGVIF